MTKSIQEAIAEQSVAMNVDDWHCLSCRNYEGKLRCSQGIFIAFEGANLQNCMYFLLGRRCRHCGRVS